MVKVKLYVEGGGDRAELRARCREGFRSFFENAGLAGGMPRVVACGGRDATFEKFRAAWNAEAKLGHVVLLVDSEGPVAHGSGPWTQLKRRDGWQKPQGATNDNAHLMVQCMESWFLADKDRLAAYFGQGFNRSTLPGQRNIEQVTKTDVLDGLRNASRQSKKGKYGKGQHSFDVLKGVDAGKVVSASAHAKRLVETLRRMTT